MCRFQHFPVWKKEISLASLTITSVRLCMELPHKLRTFECHQFESYLTAIFVPYRLLHIHLDYMMYERNQVSLIDTRSIIIFMLRNVLSDYKFHAFSVYEPIVTSHGITCDRAMCFLVFWIFFFFISFFLLFKLINSIVNDGAAPRRELGSEISLFLLYFSLQTMPRELPDR